MSEKHLIVSDSDPALAQSESERVALSVRASANAHLVCACGATPRVVATELDGRLTHAVMEHENNCPAVSPVANRAMRRAQRKGRAR